MGMGRKKNEMKMRRKVNQAKKKTRIKRAIAAGKAKA